MALVGRSRVVETWRCVTRWRRCRLALSSPYWRVTLESAPGGTPGCCCERVS